MKTLEMPSFGADMVRGRVVEWRVAPGNRVRKGDTVALIETAKGVIDMEVFEDLIIEQLLVSLDEECDVGTPIIAVSGGRSGKTVDARDERQQLRSVAPSVLMPASASDPTVVLRPAASTARISPAARLRVWQQQLDISGIEGSGPDGAIVLKDLHRHRSASSESESGIAPLSVDTERAGRFDPIEMRRAIAAVVSRSKREIPHYYLSLEVDLEKCQAWLNAYNAEAEVDDRMLINAPLMCAVAQALHQQERFNGFYRDGEFEAMEEVHLGIAIALRGQGLVTPAIHRAQTLSPVLMMQRLKGLVERSKHGGLKVSEFQGVTATLSNIGDRGVDQIFGVIFPPQVALIGIGKVNLKPVVETASEGIPRVAVHSRVIISLAADHRVSDGNSGTRLLNDINKRLQKPEAL